MSRLYVFSLSALPWLLVSASVAQTPCTRLSGTVLDSTAALIPGAQVTLDGRAAVPSGSSGRFTLPCVAPGTHTLTAAAEGFAGASVKVTMPHAGDVSFRLLPTSAASVDVDADGADAQVPAPGGTNGLIVSGKQLQALADDPDDLLRELQQLAASAGGSPGSTTISVDGFQDSATLPPKDSIAYINVAPDLFSAEYREPPFGGGRVEVYTKPGAKTYHGALFATNSSTWMNAQDPFTTSTGKVGKQRYGFDLSGPVRKTGSSFSLSLEHRSIDELAVVNAVTFDENGNPVSTNYSVPMPQRRWEGQARVDWQLGPKNIAFVTYSSTVNTLGNMGVGGSTLQEAGYNDGTNDQTVRFSNIMTFTPKLTHESRASYEWYRETDVPNSTAPGVQVSGFFTGGGATIGNGRQFKSAVEFDDDLILVTGRHTIKTGVQLLDKVRDSVLPTGFNGTYIFGSAAEYTGSVKTPEEFSNVTGNPEVKVNQVTVAGYFQDDMKLRPNLTFSYGVRYLLQTDPATYRNVVPRVGFAWSPDKKQTWKITAHFGMFNGQFAGDDAVEIHREDGVQRITSLIYNPVYGSPFTGATPIHAERTLGPGVSPGNFVIGEVSVAKELPLGFSVSAQEVQLRFLTLPYTENINSPLDANPLGVRPIAPNLNILQVESNGSGQGHGEFFGLSNFKLKRVQFFVGGLYLNLRENTDDSLFFQPQSAYTNSGEEARRDNQGVYQVFGNATVNVPGKVVFSLDGYGSGQQPYNILTGKDNNGDGDFNDRPQYAAPGAAADGTTVFQTPFGLLTNAGPIVNGAPLRPLARDTATLPWSFHLDANLQRAFVMTRNAKADHQQTLTVNVRSANFLNHTNVTADGNVLGSPQFLTPVAADTARRVEFGARYSF